MVAYRLLLGLVQNEIETLKELKRRRENKANI